MSIKVPIIMFKIKYEKPKKAKFLASELNSGNSDSSDIKANIRKKFKKMNIDEISIPVILLRFII